MIELIQIPWSPFCLVQRRILEYAGVPFKTVNIPNHDRSFIWRLTRERYYNVPVIKDGRTVVFETDNDSQVIAKYLDSRFTLNLFPPTWVGVETLLWRTIENDIEGLCFKLNDIYWKEFVPATEQLGFLRHKERRFGVGCISQWTLEQPFLLQCLERQLIPFEQMLGNREFLLGKEPHFVDFDLYGMLANFLYSGHYRIPAVHTRLGEWFTRIENLKRIKPSHEKLRSRHQRTAA